MLLKSFKSVSRRGKMIPEELEKQVQRARKEVRGGRESEREQECACVCVRLGKVFAQVLYEEMNGKRRLKVKAGQFLYKHKCFS